MLSAVILAAFLGAVSMNMQRLQGWGFLILCLIAGSLGGLGYLWARDRVLPAWERLPKIKRLFLILLMAAIVLGARFIANRHKPDEEFADLLACIGVLVALALLGAYRIWSRLLDSLHERISKH